MERIELTSHDADETRAMGAAVGRALRAGDVVMLAGDLGAGKTCFVQGAARALGVTARVQSPSFVLVRTYGGDVPVVHADVYRLNSLQELVDLGYEELFDPSSIAFVEWGDAVSGVLPPERLEVEIRRNDDETRTIVLHAPTPEWRRRLDALEAVAR